MKTDKKVYFTGGYKYQLDNKFTINLKDFCKKGEYDFSDMDVSSTFLELYVGILCLYKGFASDGASGITKDTKNSYRGAFTHDGLYKLFRLKKLDLKHRKQADKIFYRILRKDGMSWFRANYWYAGVRIGGKSSTLPKNKKVVRCCP